MGYSSLVERRWVITVDIWIGFMCVREREIEIYMRTVYLIPVVLQTISMS